jgi:hypothetical protein
MITDNTYLFEEVKYCQFLERAVSLETGYEHVCFLPEVSNSRGSLYKCNFESTGSAAAYVEVFQMFQRIFYLQVSGRIRG